MNQKHKIALGGGGYCLYAPRFPSHQLTPGFADEVLVFNALLPRLFMLAVLEDGVLLTLKAGKHDIRNGILIVEYATDVKGLKVVEHRLVSTDDRFVSTLQIENTTKNERQLTVVLWTTTDVEGEAPSLEGDSFRIRRSLRPGRFPVVPTEIVFGSPDSKGAR